MFINNLKSYLTPQEREADKNWLLNLISYEEIPQSDFLDDLFMNQVGPVWQRLFLLEYQNEPFSIIKSFLPEKLTNTCNMPSICESKVNIELKIDKENNADQIKKNISLTWPTSEESKMLLLKQREQVFIEKNYILRDKQIIRYEEEIIVPSKVEYED